LKLLEESSELPGEFIKRFVQVLKNLSTSLPWHWNVNFKELKYVEIAEG